MTSDLAEKTQLAIIKGGGHPFRRLDETALAPVRNFCKDCEFMDRDYYNSLHWRSEVHDRYRCLQYPKYEKYVDYVTGGIVYFDRERWERGKSIWSEREEAAELAKHRNACFHQKQDFELCSEHNIEGDCSDFSLKEKTTVKLVKKEKYESLFVHLFRVFFGKRSTK
jgi:hypothetical protein